MNNQLIFRHIQTLIRPLHLKHIHSLLQLLVHTYRLIDQLNYDRCWLLANCRTPD